MSVLILLVRRYWIILTTLMLIIITTLSLYPLANLPEVPGTDKTHHFIAYAALIFPAAIKRNRYFIYISLLFLIWSGAIELIQPYFNRYGEWLDILANSTGLICGLLIAQLINRFYPHK